jgi:predicted ATPase/DNA-binding SARP family transcriptional activator
VVAVFDNNYSSQLLWQGKLEIGFVGFKRFYSVRAFMDTTLVASIQLLGSVRARVGSEIVDFLPDKRFQLLAYLACRSDWASRDQIADLFWSDSSPDMARNNLRQLLARVKTFECAADLQAERHRLCWLVQTDVAAFLSATAHKHWGEAVKLYSGALLLGLEGDEVGEFGAWLELERGHLRSLWLEASYHHLLELEQSEQFAAAFDVLERLLDDDGLSEEVLARLLRLAKASGRHDRALARYAVFERQLLEELNLEPRPETQALALQLQSAVRVSAPVPEVREPVAPNRVVYAPSRLPISSTPFVGREAELADLALTLSNPEVRLLTIFGPGGMGKTRLALEAARRAEEEALFVPLAAQQGGRSLAAVVLEALGQSLKDAAQAQTLLLERLEGQTMLLVLDNSEHLLDETRSLIESLRGLAQIRVLVTSRVRLGLAEERAFELGGLVFPTVEISLSGERFEDYDAIRLLFDAAKRASQGLALSITDRFEAVSICERLGGVPLALELAGAWARMLSFSEIASEIKRNLDFLSGSVSGLPERHRGLRAVFEYSWALLEPSAQQVLVKLAVFRGGFERTTALSVTGAGNLELLTLLDHSLLRRVRGQQSRFDLHELIRQYALERLESEARLATQAREQHALFFVKLSEQASSAMQGNDQAFWLERLDLERENINAALNWTLEAHQAELGLRLAVALKKFWDVRGHGREGRDWTERLLALPEAQTRNSARAKALLGVGSFATHQGDYLLAAQHLGEALEIFRVEGDQLGEAIALRALGELKRVTGELEQASGHLEASIAICRNLNQPSELANALSSLGVVFAYLDDDKTARKHFEESLGIYERLEDLRGVANQLSNIANTLKDPVQEVPLTERSLAIKRELGDQEGIGISVFNLGNITARLGDLARARGQMSEGLEIFQKLGHRRNTAHVLISVADLEVALEHPIRALELTAAVQAFTEKAGFRFNSFTQTVLETTQANASVGLDPKDVEAALERGRAMSLERAVKLALNAERPNTMTVLR